jgi:ribosomal protein L34E
MREVEPPEGSSPGAKRRVPDGDPIEDYFPAVIDEVTFARSRQIRRSKRRISGPKGVGFSNLLSGLATCGHCGATMHRVNKGKPPKGKVYLACSRARRRVNGCTAPSVRYEPVVLALLNSLTAEDLGLAKVLGLDDQGAEDGRRAAIREQMEAVEGSLAETEEAIEKVLVGIERAKNDQVTDTLLARLEEQQERKVALEAQRGLLEDQLAEVDHEATARQGAVEETMRLVKEWTSRLEKADENPALLYDMNLRLNNALRQVVDGVAVGVSEGAKEWIEEELVPWRLKRGPVFAHPVFEEKFNEVMSCADHGGKALSMTATFRGHEGRHLVVYGDAKVPGRFVGVSVVVDKGGGGVEGVELAISIGR